MEKRLEDLEELIQWMLDYEAEKLLNLREMPAALRRKRMKR